MRIQTLMLGAMSAILVLASVIFSGYGFYTQRQFLMENIDQKLLMATICARNTLPVAYHDRLQNAASCSDREYKDIVEQYNALCQQFEIDQLFSVLQIDADTVISSSASLSKTLQWGDYPRFFEPYPNPMLFQAAFAKMQVQYIDSVDEWGVSRLVIAPAFDRYNRPHAFVAVINVEHINPLLWQLARHSLFIFLLLFFLGLGISIVLAYLFAKPISRLTQAATAIAAGDYTHPIADSGSIEIRSLSQSLQHLGASVQQHVETIEKGKEQLRIILNSIGEGVIAADETGRVLRMNPVAETLTGWSLEEAKGKPVAQIYNIQSILADKEIGENDVENPAAYSVPRRCEYLLTSRDGVVRRVADSGMPMLDAHGNIIGIVVAFRDITSWHEKSVQLRASEARYRSLVEQAPLPIYVHCEGRMVFLNPAAAHLFAHSEQNDLTRIELLHLVPQEEQERLKAMLQPRRYREEKRKTQMTIVTPTRKRLRVDAVSIPVPFEGKDARLCMCMEVAQQKNSVASKESSDSPEERESYFRNMPLLVGGMVHEFNNLLMVVLGNADLLSYSLHPVGKRKHEEQNKIENVALCDDEAQHATALQGLEHLRFIKEIEIAAQQAVTLCRQLLTCVGKGPFLSKAIDISQLVTDMAPVLEKEAGDEVQFFYQLESALSSFNGDGKLVSDMVMELVQNAIEAFDPKAGMITIRTGGCTISTENLAFSVSHGKVDYKQGVFIEVSDTGCGVAPYFQERIFEPFFSTKTKHRGLGLAVVLGIVQRHAGVLLLRSPAEGGATFRVVFPEISGSTHSAHQKQGTLMSFKDNSGHTKRTVLLVDDEEMVRHIGQRMLEKADFTVLTAENGRHAINTFQQNKESIACVVLDLTMPEMDGEECFHGLRRINPALPVVLSSGYDESEIGERFGDIPHIGYLQKPYKAIELVELVNRLIAVVTEPR